LKTPSLVVCNPTCNLFVWELLSPYVVDSNIWNCSFFLSSLHILELSGISYARFLELLASLWLAIVLTSLRYWNDADIQRHWTKTGELQFCLLVKLKLRIARLEWISVLNCSVVVDSVLQYKQYKIWVCARR